MEVAKDLMRKNNNDASDLAPTVELIMSGLMVDKPVLQLLGQKKLAGEGGDRYRLMLSDGVHSFSSAMLVTQLNEMVTSGQLETYTVIRLDKYHSQPIQGDRRVIILQKVTVVTSGDQVGRKLGNPKAYTPGAQAAQADPPQALQQVATEQQSQQILDNAKKLQNFLSTLLRLASASNQLPETVHNVKDLIQGLIDGRVEPEQFPEELQKKLKSSPSLYLVHFLKKNLPALRQSLILKEMSIDGVQAPRISAAMTAAITTGGPRPLNPTPIAPQGMSKVSLAAPMNKQEKRKYDEALRDDDDINDVATMGGVNRINAIGVFSPHNLNRSASAAGQHRNSLTVALMPPQTLGTTTTTIAATPPSLPPKQYRPHSSPALTGSQPAQKPSAPEAASFAPEDEFTCPICLDVAEAAMEMDCCHQIYCAECVAGLPTCPSCRQPAISKVAHFVRRVIGNLTTTCPNCGTSLPRSEVTSHDRSCPKRLLVCKAPGCDFQSQVKEMALHIAKDHTDTLIDKVDMIFQTDFPARDDPLFGSAMNARGVVAKLGSTGKYYCGLSLGDKDSLCRGGSGDGSNCEACMRLDIARRVVPRGGLVNRAGHVAMYSQTQVKFYCGALYSVRTQAQKSDKYCGPRNGPNCFSCDVLKQQAATLYRTIMRN